MDLVVSQTLLRNAEYAEGVFFTIKYRLVTKNDGAVQIKGETGEDSLIIP